MFFNSQAYLIFFSAVFILYWAIPWRRPRVYLLLAASFYFYAAWSQWLALLVTATTVMDYLLARALEATAGPRKRKLLFLTSLFVNLGLLCYFKYVNFFLDSLNEALASVGGEKAFSTLSILVPFGISFYTFEAISYTFDVYRRKIAAERNLANFMLFILFFPHLVAGPIVRAKDFLRQVPRKKRWNWLRIQVGVQYFLVGLFLKMAIADAMSMYSDPIFTQPALFSSGAVWLGVLAYAIRIYGDFAGYSFMAIGSAHLLGYRLNMNFNMPYLAANVTDFWRRWHISLSTWLRDYLFIPLGGSRGSKLLTARNLMITMVLGGLWHGAYWTFLIWGFLHGLLLVVHKWFREWSEDKPRLTAALATPPGYLLRVAVTFFCVMLCWVFFQGQPAVNEKGENVTANAAADAASVKQAAPLTTSLVILERMFTPHQGAPAPLNNRRLWYTVALMFICQALLASGAWRKIGERLPAPALGAGYAVTLTFALLLAPPAGKVFIYFNF